MNKQKKFALNLLKGFTIIEIIVVVAIIAVLASIILANVTSYNIKSKDAAAKGNLNTLLTAAVKYRETHNDYSEFFDSDDVNNIGDKLTNLGYLDEDFVVGTDGNSNYCFSVRLKQFSTPTYYCVDLVGTKIQSENVVCVEGDGPGICEQTQPQ